MRIETLNPVTSTRLAVVDIGATLQTAAMSLSEPATRLIVVCHEDGRVAGVLNGLDIVRHLATSGSADEPVATLMSRPLVACGPEDDVQYVRAQMIAQKLENVPVIGADFRPLGILDIRDLTDVLLDQEERQGRMLVNYVMGVGYR